MRDDLRCDCHICKVERHIFDLLAEPPGSIEFLRFASTSPQLAKFTNVSELLAYLHSPRSGDYACSDVGQLLTALVAALATVASAEVSPFAPQPCLGSLSPGSPSPESRVALHQTPARFVPCGTVIAAR
jgi:hypothetical protein